MLLPCRMSMVKALSIGLIFELFVRRAVPMLRSPYFARAGKSCLALRPISTFNKISCGAAAAATRATRAGLPLCGSGPDNVWQGKSKNGTISRGVKRQNRNESLLFYKYFPKCLTENNNGFLYCRLITY